MSTYVNISVRCHIAVVIFILGFLAGSNVLYADKCFNAIDLKKINDKLLDLDNCIAKDKLNLELILNLQKQITVYKDTDTLKDKNLALMKSSQESLLNTIDLQNAVIKEKGKNWDWVSFVVGVGAGILVTAGTAALVVYMMK